MALRCGIAVAEFWEMTTYETYMAIEATTWRLEQQQRQQVALAWRTAALTRARRLPSLTALLASARPVKKLTGKELARRRQEHAEMTRHVDTRTLNMLGQRLERAKAAARAGR